MAFAGSPPSRDCFVHLKICATESTRLVPGADMPGAGAGRVAGRPRAPRSIRNAEPLVDTGESAEVGYKPQISLAAKAKKARSGIEAPSLATRLNFRPRFSGLAEAGKHQKCTSIGGIDGSSFTVSSARTEERTGCVVVRFFRCWSWRLQLPDVVRFPSELDNAGIPTLSGKPAGSRTWTNASTIQWHCPKQKGKRWRPCWRVNWRRW